MRATRGTRSIPTREPDGPAFTYHAGRPNPQKGRMEEVRDEGPHAVYRVRNEETSEIQVITQGQID